MQVTYNGDHSLLIGNFDITTDVYGRTVEQYNESRFVNTWDDYGLIPKDVPVIAPPDVQENTVEVPGSNGIVDLSDVLLGYPLYYNRSGSLDFYVDHTHPKYISWDTTYDTILNNLHGFKGKVILTDAKGYYYEGRLKVNQWKSDKLASSISIDYNFAPYKRMMFTTFEDWLWDPFDFVYGTIPDKKAWYERTVTSDTSVEDSSVILQRVQAGTLPVVPDILIELIGTSPEDFDHLSDADRPRVLYTQVSGRQAAAKVMENLENGIGVVSYLKNSEQKDYDKSTGTIGTSHYYVKHDPLITVGCPGGLLAGSIVSGIRLINPRSYNIKMTVDFRQGRL